MLIGSIRSHITVMIIIITSISIQALVVRKVKKQLSVKANLHSRGSRQKCCVCRLAQNETQNVDHGKVDRQTLK